jgi:formiminotetrahydrofolate cyclodeaminase
MDASASISGFLDATAAKQPSPGGGAVAALAGALAAAIGEMVLNYSVGKKELAQHRAALDEILRELTRARQVMLELMVEDQAAFEALSAARKACGNRGDCDPAFAAALLACVRIPQSVGASAAAVLDLCGRAAPIANRMLLSDLAVCCELSMAVVRCSAHNVRVNLADVSDPGERSRLDAAMTNLIARSSERVRGAVPAIWRRLAQISDV